MFIIYRVLQEIKLKLESGNKKGYLEILFQSIMQL